MRPSSLILRSTYVSAFSILIGSACSGRTPTSKEGSSDGNTDTQSEASSDGDSTGEGGARTSDTSIDPGEDATAGGSTGDTDAASGTTESGTSSDPTEDLTGGQNGDCAALVQEAKATTVGVYLLADSSSSMFTPTSVSSGWAWLREATLEATKELDDRIDFGFGTISGVAQACTGLEHRIDVGPSTHASIKAAYERVATPTTKIDGPIPLALTQLTPKLTALQPHRKMHILLLTDGAGDFCTDATPICATDATYAALQLAYDQGISTMVAMPEDPYEDGAFLAQAGQGQSPNWRDGLDVNPYLGNLDSQCTLSPETELWRLLREEKGHAPLAGECGENLPEEGNVSCFLPAADYSEAGGSAVPLIEDSVEKLSQSMKSALRALIPCEFELNFALEPDADLEDAVSLDGAAVPVAELEIIDETHLRLSGQACSNYQEGAEVELHLGCDDIAPL